jgi:hypothetical protein
LTITPIPPNVTIRPNVFENASLAASSTVSAEYRFA